MTLNKFLNIHPEVAEALANNRPVVALESTIISHGMPYPQNTRTALEVEQVIRDQGAIPATIAILDGKLCVGLNEADIDRLGKTGTEVMKCSRRDIPFALSQDLPGATTVAATMLIAQMAGIKIFATGGIGGVHRDAPETMDISADLSELAKTPVAVVCAGIKSILDLGLTLEYLETQGVPVIGYQTAQLPAFYCRTSEHQVNFKLDRPQQIAAFLNTQWQLGYQQGAVIANPIPEHDGLDANWMDQQINLALEEMKSKGIKGKATTPFLLAKISEQTQGKSLAANIALVKNNARLAAEIAKSMH